MSAKMSIFVHPSEVYTEDVLKTMRETIKNRSTDIKCRYRAPKTATRNDQTYLTCVHDEQKAWREKFGRRTKNLSRGFFADKTKPYQTVGRVYLEAGDLILDSITEDLRERILNNPRISGERSASRKPVSVQKKLLPLSPVTNKKLSANDATAGYTALKQRLSEVIDMKRRVFAEQSLISYLVEKERESEMPEKRDLLKMQAPSGRNWGVVRNFGKTFQVGKFFGFVKAHDQKPEKGPFFKRVKKLRNVTNKLLKPMLGSELRDLEEREKLIMQWRTEKRHKYLKTKLVAINSLFCALFNMKVKLIKHSHPLSYKHVKELLSSDVSMDEYGKPMPWKSPQVTGTEDTVSHLEGTPEAIVDSAGHKQQGLGVPNVPRRRTSSTLVPSPGTPNRSTKLKVNPHLSKFGGRNTEFGVTRIDTWEELLNAGERGMRTSVAGSKFLKLRRRDTLTSLHETVAAPWMTVALAEKTIMDRKRVNVSGTPSKRRAEDVLQDVKTDFAKLQKKMSKETDDICNRQRMEQSKLIKCKFQTINLGPITRLCLEKMRIDARLRTRDRKDSSIKPLKWFVDLKTEIMKETSGHNNEIFVQLLEKISRFQFEDAKTMGFAKEKICLLVMSMSADVILTVEMTDAISFILDKVLGAPSELLQFWLGGRKLDKISIMQKFQGRRHSDA